MSWRLGVAVPLILAMVGCATARPAPAPTPAGTSSSAAGSLESIAGDYSLVAIDGHALPYPNATSSEATKSSSWPVLGGTLSLRTNGTFHIETTYSTGPAGTDKNAYQFTGTCFGNGAAFTMVWDGGGETPLAARGDTIVIKNEGRAYSYVRR